MHATVMHATAWTVIHATVMHATAYATAFQPRSHSHAATATPSHAATAPAVTSPTFAGVGAITGLQHAVQTLRGVSQRNVCTLVVRLESSRHISSFGVKCENIAVVCFPCVTILRVKYESSQTSPGSGFKTVNSQRGKVKPYGFSY